MGRREYQRIVHTVTAERGASDVITYALRKAMKTKAEDKEKSAYARIKDHKRVSEEALAGALAHRLGLSPRMAKAVLEELTEICEAKLREGYSVTLPGFLTLGATFTGRVDPARPFDVRTLPLAPWARFIPEFTRRVNNDVKIAYESPLLPPKVKVTTVRRGKNTVTLTGSFRQIEHLMADLLVPSGDVVPCKVFLDIPKKSTRPSGKTVHLLPEGKLPAGAMTLRLKWLDAIGDLNTQEFPLPAEA